MINSRMRLNLVVLYLDRKVEFAIWEGCTPKAVGLGRFSRAEGEAAGVDTGELSKSTF